MWYAACEGLTGKLGVGVKIGLLAVCCMRSKVDTMP